MSNTIWAVDGSFFAQRLSGIQRYSIELLAALDRIVPPGFVEIVTPPGVETPHYTNIKVVSFGTHRGGVWQQLDYPRYLRQRRAGTCHLQCHPAVRLPWHCRCARCLLPRTPGLLHRTPAGG